MSHFWECWQSTQFVLSVWRHQQHPEWAGCPFFKCLWQRRLARGHFDLTGAPCVRRAEAERCVWGSSTGDTHWTTTTGLGVGGGPGWQCVCVRLRTNEWKYSMSVIGVSKWVFWTVWVWRLHVFVVMRCVCIRSLNVSMRVPGKARIACVCVCRVFSLTDDLTAVWLTAAQTPGSVQEDGGGVGGQMPLKGDLIVSSSVSFTAFSIVV